MTTKRQVCGDLQAAKDRVFSLLHHKEAGSITIIPIKDTFVVLWVAPRMGTKGKGVAMKHTKADALYKAPTSWYFCEHCLELWGDDELREGKCPQCHGKVKPKGREG